MKKKIAYLFLVHEKPDLLARAVSRLQSPHADIFVHVDGKKDIAEFKQTLPGNVIFMQDRISVNHGGFTQVKAMTAILEFAVGHGDYDLYQFMSGRDYPLHSIETILAFHEARPCTDFMNYYELSDGASFSFNLYNYHFVDFLAKLKGKPKHYVTRLKQALNKYGPKRKFLNGYNAYRGSNWVALSQDTARKAVSFLKTPEGRKFKNHFRFAWGSDEIFFQTLVMHLKPERIEERSHYVDWTEGREHPSVLDERDWDHLAETKSRYARKFDLVKSAGLMDRLDARAETETDFNFESGKTGRWIT